MQQCHKYKDNRQKKYYFDIAHFYVEEGDQTTHLKLPEEQGSKLTNKQMSNYNTKAISSQSPSCNFPRRSLFLMVKMKVISSLHHSDPLYIHSDSAFSLREILKVELLVIAKPFKDLDWRSSVSVIKNFQVA